MSAAIWPSASTGMCCIFLVHDEFRGAPKCIRSDNGPEFIARALRRWLDRRGVEALYVEPGSPWENGYAESFHSRLRDEFLALEVFESLSAAKRLTRQWREDYNHPAA
jgi:putative transposase